jgi:hypothetical protein
MANAEKIITKIMDKMSTAPAYFERTDTFIGLLPPPKKRLNLRQVFMNE